MTTVPELSAAHAMTNWDAPYCAAGCDAATCEDCELSEGDVKTTEPLPGSEDQKKKGVKCIYLAQHQNTFVKGAGKVENQSEALFKVGFGAEARPEKGAAQNVAPWIVHYQWFCIEGRDPKFGDEKSCHNFLKSLGMHVINDQGTEWFCAQPTTTATDFFLLVNGFLAGDGDLVAFEKGKRKREEAEAEDANKKYSVREARKQTARETANSFRPPTSKPDVSFIDALQRALHKTRRGSYSNRLNSERLENDSVLRGVARMLPHLLVVFKKFTDWPGNDPKEIRNNPQLQCILKQTDERETELYGCSGNGRGTSSQSLLWYQDLQEEKEVRTETVLEDSGDVTLMIEIDGVPNVYKATFPNE